MATPLLKLPVIPVNPEEKHRQRIVDFSIEDNLKETSNSAGRGDYKVEVRNNRWLAIDLGSFRLCRFNWVVFAFSSIVLWAFVIGVLTSPDNAAGKNSALAEFSMWQSWITQNFTWLYIGTQVQQATASPARASCTASGTRARRWLRSLPACRPGELRPSVTGVRLCCRTRGVSSSCTLRTRASETSSLARTKRSPPTMTSRGSLCSSAPASALGSTFMA